MDRPLMMELLTFTFASGFFPYVGTFIQMSVASLLMAYVLVNPLLIELFVTKSTQMGIPNYFLEVILRWQYTTILGLFLSFTPLTFTILAISLGISSNSL